MDQSSSLVLLLLLSTTLLVTSHQQDDDTQLATLHGHTSNRTKRSQPTTTCTTSTEGQAVYDTTTTTNHIVWVCKTHKWIPFQLSPYTGLTKDLAAPSCKEIKQQLIDNCNKPPTSKVYWVKDKQVYCDMSLDGGGWTLVWKNSFMDNLPLSDNMRYYSGYYKACTSPVDGGWCNIPDKASFSPTEQMIVAYHNTALVYAYKGIFNRNIDYDWSGGILLDFMMITDKCTIHNGVQPAPYASSVPGITFDKRSPYSYYSNCDTLHGSLTSPRECRWGDCRLPLSISATQRFVQMTMAIFVR